MQNVLIKAHLNKEETVTELGQTKNKLFILQEKKISNENEIRQLTSDLAKLNKQIELFDLNIKKLNTTLAEERQKLEQLEDDRSAKSEETFARVADLEEGIEAVKERAKQLEVSRHFVVERVREVDLLVYEWEDKVKAIKETADHLTLERARDSEMETMKSEVTIVYYCLAKEQLLIKGSLPRPTDERSGKADYGADLLLGAGLNFLDKIFFQHLLLGAARRETRGDLREDQRRAVCRVGQEEGEGGPVRRREEDGGLEEQHQEAGPADQGHSESV